MKGRINERTVTNRNGREPASLILLHTADSWKDCQNHHILHITVLSTPGPLFLFVPTYHASVEQSELHIVNAAVCVGTQDAGWLHGLHVPLVFSNLALSLMQTLPRLP
jgi:hypothetical protein